jgi:hypothetical protein
MSDLARAAKALGRDTVPHVVELVRDRRRPDSSDSFDTVRLVVEGIAAARD